MINQFPKEKFRVHVRRVWRDGANYKISIGKGQSVYLYPQDEKRTIGFHITDDNYAVVATLFYIGEEKPLLRTHSRCNSMDQPSRKEGVRIAIERLEKAARANGFI